MNWIASPLSTSGFVARKGHAGAAIGPPTGESRILGSPPERAMTPLYGHSSPGLLARMRPGLFIECPRQLASNSSKRSTALPVIHLRQRRSARMPTPKATPTPSPNTNGPPPCDSPCRGNTKSQSDVHSGTKAAIRAAFRRLDRLGDDSLSKAHTGRFYTCGGRDTGPFVPPIRVQSLRRRGLNIALHKSRRSLPGHKKAGTLVIIVLWVRTRSRRK